jgi:UDP-N-acetylmuramoylalanine--D-glutamate ligase
VATLAELPLRGPHNLRNIAAALALLSAIEVDPASETVRSALGDVRPLAHRLEPAGVVAGVSFFNDSKATNPDSVEVALRSFADPIVLIAGGRAKDADYGALIPLIRDHVAEAVLIGEAAPLLAGAWAPSGIPAHHAGDMPDAVGLAFRRARALGAVVLLSPGCASFDMFRDFEDRGDRFKRAVRELGEEG